MITKITLWLEKGKPTKVRTIKHEDFYMEDLSQIFDKSQRKGAEHVARQKKNRSSPKG